MKKQVTEFAVQGNLQGERIKMQIDMNALEHIMSVLTDLYSDPEMAVIREYSTNAYDAHVAAGNPSPIEVTLPSTLSPFLRIRDYGDGLDADDIRDVYSLYGASTKTDTDDQVGMLGLGCKSALTYTNQFTLVGIKDGVKTQVSVSRDEDDTASMTLLGTSETTEASGVEVIIPTSNYRSIEEKAAEFYRYWKPGTVLVNGEEPKSISGIWIADDLLLTKEVDEPQVVMGNVPYPADQHYLSKGNHQLVAFVPIGSISFAPSREALRYNSITKKTLESLKERLNSELKSSLEKQINAASDNYAVLRLLESMGDLATGQRFEYNGQEIPSAVEAPDKKPFVLYNRKPTHYYYRSRGTRNDSWENAIGYRQYVNAIWFEEYIAPPKSRITPTRIEKINQWAARKGLDPQYVIMSNEKVDTTWVDPSTVYNWAEIEAEKLPRKTGDGTPTHNKNGRLAGSYDVYTQDGWQFETPGDDIKGRTIIYYDPKWQVLDTSLLPKKSFAVVKLSPNRVTKFKRVFPKAQDIDEFYKKQFDKWVKTLSEDEKLAVRLESAGLDEYRCLDDTRVDDPDLAQYIRISHMDVSELIQKNKSFYSRARLSLHNGFDSHPMDKYPLLTALGSYAMLRETNKNHLYIYVNAAYAASKEG